MDQRIKIGGHKPIPLSRIQKLHLERLKLVNFNSFDGQEVARLLLDKRDSWDGFIVGNFEYECLAELRDIEDDGLVDKLYLKTTNSPGDYDYVNTLPPRLEVLVDTLKRAKANEIGWLDGQTKTWHGIPGSNGFTRTYEEANRALCNSFFPNLILVRAFWD